MLIKGGEKIDVMETNWYIVWQHKEVSVCLLVSTLYHWLAMYLSTFSLAQYAFSLLEMQSSMKEEILS